MLDIATGAVHYSGTSAQLAGLGDVVTGIAARNGELVFGDGSPYMPVPFFPLTSTVRSLWVLPHAYSMPVVYR